MRNTIIRSFFDLTATYDEITILSQEGDMKRIIDHLTPRIVNQAKDSIAEMKSFIAFTEDYIAMADGGQHAN